MGVYTHTEGSWLSRRGAFLVALILFHLLLLWALKSGFAVKFIEAITPPIVAEIIKEPPPDEPPPPPPSVQAVVVPPVSVPPLLVDIQIPEPPPIQVTPTIVPPAPPSPPVVAAVTPQPPSAGSSGTARAILFAPSTEDYYPPASVQLDEEGKVRVKLCYDVKGIVNSSDLETTSGKKRLDDAAVKMGKKFKFRPATRDGKQPIADCVVLPVAFSLKGMK